LSPHIRVVRRRISASVLLGIVALSRPGCVSVNGPSGVLPAGVWGGEHLLLVVTDSIATLEFDCATGRIPAPIVLDDGGFVVGGTFTRETGGPVREGQLNPPQPAAYIGRIAGDRLNITVVLTDEQRTVGSFELKRGSTGRVFKCL
jgi:hypothetical protein